MMKKRIGILIIFILVIVGLLKLNNGYYTFWNSNSVHVSTEGTLDSRKVKIMYGNAVKNRDVKGKRSSKYSSTLYDGKQKSKLVNEYGENDFLIEYGKTHYLEFRHFKLNCNHQHKYNFHFYQKDTSIFVRVNIKGQDARSFTSKLLKK